MKRKTVFSMLLAAAVLLCACSGTPSAQSVPAESTSSAGSQTDLQQWAGGALTQIGERLLVINKSELANMEYLEENGELSVRESILEGYAFLSVQDYLSSTPNYTPVNDMMDALFTQ